MSAVQYEIRSSVPPFEFEVHDAVGYVRMLCRTIARIMEHEVLGHRGYTARQLELFKRMLLSDDFFDDQANVRELARRLRGYGHQEIVREPEMTVESSRPYMKLHLAGEDKPVDRQLVAKQTISLADGVDVEFYVCTDCVAYWRV
jgi:hypothetical protein